MATEHTKHQVESEERQDVVKDLIRVMLAYYWRDLCSFYHNIMTDLLIYVLYTSAIVSMNPTVTDIS